MELTTEPLRTAWDVFLERVEGSNIFQSPEMAVVLDGTNSCKSHVVACEESGEIKALMAGSLVSYGPISLPVVTTRAIITGGPLGEEEFIPLLVKEFDKRAKRDALLTQIRNLQAPANKDLFLSNGYRWEDHVNYIIDLTKDEHVLLKAMTKGRRRNIQEAERGGLELVELGLGELQQSYRLLQETYSRAKIPLSDISLFRRAMEVLSPGGMLWSFGVRSDDILCAVIFLLRWQKTIFNWYNGTSELALKLHANEWLVWESIQRAREDELQTFDLGGAGNPSERYGPGEFKRHFGGRPVNPGRLVKRHHRHLDKISTMGFRLWRKIV